MWCVCVCVCGGGGGGGGGGCWWRLGGVGVTRRLRGGGGAAQKKNDPGNFYIDPPSPVGRPACAQTTSKQPSHYSYFNTKLEN